MLSQTQKLQQAYKYCFAIAQNHYENFPVASYLVSKELRRPISVVYAFARSADDFADEGDLTQQQRLELLNNYISELDQIKHSLDNHSAQTNESFFHSSHNKIFIALADVIYRFKVPITLFYDLIMAFKQDVTTIRYQNFDEILDYCRLSANPVGQILLYLNKSASPQNLIQSDAICTGLQLINFYQDIAQDIDENDRLYLPTDEMTFYTVSINDIKEQINNVQTHKLINFQLQRAKILYESGKPLCSALKGRFAIEIRMIYAGGQLILDKLEKNTHSMYQRPRLNRSDKLKILWQGFFPTD